jgi:phosphoribosylglycinamide formyltransferase-1
MNYIAVFASGSGTNAENIIRFFRTHQQIRVKTVLSNRSNAGVLERASRLGVETLTFSREDFYDTRRIIDALIERDISLVVLAGFLWLVPEQLVRAFQGRIINIHPALLPAYGGKGMYGSRVHEAVIANNEKESGITIHHVNEQYDDGDIIFQSRCPVKPGDSAETLAVRVHELEYRHYPVVIEQLLLGQPRQ